ncbi:MAG: cytochrome c oxidase assembly factor Coa1 family protein [Planctomycetota bacterium]|jgi:hypothetical protein
MQQQPPRNWWSRNWKWFLPVCIGTPVLVCGGFVALLVSAVFGLIKGSEVYEQAMYTARTDTAVIAAMGTPIEDGYLVTGNIEFDASSGSADLAIPISGPNGTGTIYADADKYQGEWYFNSLGVVVEETDEWIDLLGGP